MHPENLKSCNQAIDGANICHRVSPKKMLLSRAEDLRRQAHDLEALAYHLPDCMPESVETTLGNTIAAGLYR